MQLCCSLRVRIACGELIVCVCVCMCVRPQFAGPDMSAAEANQSAAPAPPASDAPSGAAPPQQPPGPRVIIHSLPKTSKWNTEVAAAKGWPTGPSNKRQHTSQAYRGHAR